MLSAVNLVANEFYFLHATILVLDLACMRTCQEGLECLECRIEMGLHSAVQINVVKGCVERRLKPRSRYL